MPDDDFLYQFQEPLPEDFKQALSARLKLIAKNTNHRSATTALKKTVPVFQARRPLRRRRITLALGALTSTVAAVFLILSLAYLGDFDAAQEGVLDVTPPTPLHLGDGSVDWLAWSPDGGRLAAAGSRKVFLYDAALNLLATWEAGTRTSALAFSDGVLAVGGYDGTVRLWNPTTGAEIVSFQAHAGSVSALAFVPGKAWLATTGDDFTVALWSIETGVELDRAWSERAPDLVTKLHALTVNPAGDLLAAGDEEGVVWLWRVSADGRFTGLVAPGPLEIADGEALWQLNDDGELVRIGPRSQAGVYMTLAFSPNGDRLAVGAGNELTVFDTVHWQTMISCLWPNSPYLMAIDYTSDGAALFVALGEAYEPSVESLRVVDTSASDVQIPLPDEHYTQVALSPDGTQLAAIAGDHTLVLWEITGYTLNETARHRAGTGFFFDMDTANGLVAASTQREVWLFDAVTGEALQTWTFTTPPPWFYSVNFSPSGTKLVVQAYATLDNPPESYEYFVLDLAAQAGEATPWMHQSFSDIPPSDIAFHPSGTVFASGGEAIRFWEVGAAGVIESAEWAPIAEAIGVSSRALHGDAGIGGGIARLAFSPDGAMLAGWVMDDGSGNWHLYVWDLATGQQVFEVSGADGRTGLFAGFTPDGARVLMTSAGDDPAVYFWEIETGQRVLTLSHDALVFHAAFSPDSKWLAIAADDGVWLWDGQDLDAATSPRKILDVNAMRVHFDGESVHMLIQLYDGSMMVWPLSLDEQSDYSDSIVEK